MTFLRRALRLSPALLVGLPTAALAQYPGVPLPSPNAPPAPLILDPSSSAAAPAAPAPAAPAKAPTIIQVTPDGKLVEAKPAGPSGYYAADGAAPEEPDQGAVFVGATVPELHVVRGGDTLWDICGLYFNDPWQWPKVWSYNPQITNPHWIYPGDLVRLLPRGLVTEAAPPPVVARAAPEAPVEAPVVVPAAKPAEVSIRSLAFVEDDALKTAMTVDGAVDEKTLLSVRDEVYLRYPADHAPSVGQRYAIYGIENRVRQPGSTKGDDSVGAYVRVVGEVQVTSVKQDKRARATITVAEREITRGLKVGPLRRVFKSVPASPAKVDAQGTIIAMLTSDQLLGLGEVVFLDLGEASGLEVGNRLTVVRRGDALLPRMSPTAGVGQDDRRYPARGLGEVEIVEVGAKVSIGLMTRAAREMGVGDLVMMQRASR